MTKKVRSSNIELLRMLAMFLVLLVHADFFSLGEPSVEEIRNNGVDSFLRIFFEAISIVCVNVFVLISGWFGIRPSFRGITNFLFQCLFFLIILYSITLILGTNILNITGLKNCFFAGNANWFIKAYLLLYILSPTLNRFVENTNRREFKRVLIGFFIFVCTYGWIGAMGFICNGYSTLFFIGLYLLARYIRQYSPRWTNNSYLTDVTIYFGIVFLVTVTSFLVPLLFGRSFPLSFWSYSSPTTIMGSLFLFLTFSKVHFHNRLINWCGVSCFAVYLLHASPTTLYHFRDQFIWLHNSNSAVEYWTYTFIILLAIFITSIMVDKIRIYCWNFCWNKCLSTIDNKLFKAKD